MPHALARLTLIASLCLGGMTVFAQSVSVTTWHNDNSRTGKNVSETRLTVSNVNSSGFGKLFAYKVDGQIYAQPLYVPSVPIP